MRNPLIGIILKALLKEYDSGVCDNLSEDINNLLNEKLADLRKLIAMLQDETMTIELVSIFLNVTRLTVNNYVKAGKLHPKKQLGGVLLFKKKEVLTLIKNRK